MSKKNKENHGPNEFYNKICQMTNIPRFLGMKLHTPYTCAEHSYRVSILSLMIAKDYNQRNPENPLDMTIVLEKALLHDVDVIPTKNNILIPKDPKNRVTDMGITY